MRTCVLGFILIMVAFPTLPHDAAVPAPMCVQPNAVSAATTAGKVLLVGTVDGRLYRSTTHTPCFVALSAPPLHTAIGLVVVPPGHPSWLIVGTTVGMSMFAGQYQGPGLYRSEDEGRTWRLGTTGLGRLALLPSQLAALPDGTLLLAYGCPLPTYATCTGGLARSSDGGRSWHAVGPRGWVGRAVLAPGAKDLIAILSSSTAPRRPARVMRSSDTGRTWQDIGSLPGTAGDVTTVFSPQWDRSLILAGYGAISGKPMVARSTTGGQRWTAIARTLSQYNGGYGLVAAFAAPRYAPTLLLSLYGAIYRSDDNGATWIVSSTGLPGYGRMVIATLFMGPDGVTVYAGNVNVSPDSSGQFHTVKGEPGLYRSTDGGVTWAPNP